MIFMILAKIENKMASLKKKHFVCISSLKNENNIKKGLFFNDIVDGTMINYDRNKKNYWYVLVFVFKMQFEYKYQTIP